MNGISRPSTNESAVAMSQYAAGAAKGKRRRAKSGSTITATAGTANHSDVLGAPGESRPMISSSMAAIPRTAISSSNQNSRASVFDPVHALNVPHSSLDAPPT